MTFRNINIYMASGKRGKQYYKGEDKMVPWKLKRELSKRESDQLLVAKHINNTTLIRTGKHFGNQEVITNFSEKNFTGLMGARAQQCFVEVIGNWNKGYNFEQWLMKHTTQGSKGMNMVTS